MSLLRLTLGTFLALAASPLAAALSITQFTCDPDTVPGGPYAQPGDYVLYQIQVTASTAATNVVAWETLPAQLAYSACSPGGSFAGQLAVWSFGSASAGQSFTGWVLCAVPSPQAYGATVAAVAAAASDSDPQVASMAASFILGPGPISFSKSVSPAAAGPGQTVTYSLSYSVPGYQLAAYDPLDTVGGQPAGWTRFGSASGTWSVPSDGAGGGYLQISDPGSGQWPVLIRDTPAGVCDGLFQGDLYIDNSNTYDVVFVFRFQDTNNAWMILAQSDNNNYQVQVNHAGTQYFYGNVGGINPSAWYTCKVLVQGNNVRCKMWVRGSVEPAGWPLNVNIPAAETVPCAGAKLGFQANEGADRFDNLHVWLGSSVQQAAIWDTLPGGLSFTSAWGGVVPSAGLLSFGPQDLSGSAGLTFTAQVLPGGACNGVIQNQASLGSPYLTYTAQASANLALPACSPTDTATPSITASVTPTLSPTITLSATMTLTPSATPTLSPSPTASSSPTPRPTATPTQPALLLHLYPNSPNPFGSGGIDISFWVSRPCRITITVYDVSGERVVALPGRAVPWGDNEILWDGRNSGGKPVASGVYIYRVEAHADDGEDRSDFAKCAALR